jgi:hypothetical protein
VSVALISVNIAVYAPVALHEFVTWDDPQYLLDNPHVSGGLTKSMLVTLPFVLLLLDVWPLGRVTLEWSKRLRSRAIELVREKLPLIALAALRLTPGNPLARRSLEQLTSAGKVSR